MKNYIFKACITTMLLLFFGLQAEATHFRGGHLTWEPNPGVSATTADFTLIAAFRWTSFSSPAVGAIITENVGGTGLFFGDGGSTGTLDFIVISIDPVNNWFLAQALEPGSATKTTVSHTYATADDAGAPWVAELCSSARTSGELNNPSGRYRVLTLVELTSGNRSPVSSLPAIVNMSQSATAGFLVTASDADPGTTLTYRLATSAEASCGFGFNQPTAGGFALSIDAVSGLVSWNTTAAVLGGLYSCQIVIEDRDALTNALRTQVAIDFLIEIVDCPSANVAPTYDTPSPTCGTTFNVVAGTLVGFTVAASDTDPADIVTLNTGGIPAGATLAPVLPSHGNPVSTAFSWTPSIADAGAHVIVFSATDICGAQTLCSYTIDVVACPTIMVDGADQTVYFGYAPAECATIEAMASGGASPYSYLWGTGATTMAITACPMATTVYSVTVTDDNGCTGAGDVTINVVDVRCGKKLDKVMICHLPSNDPSKAKTLCIGADGVADHLADHDDYLGPCTSVRLADYTEIDKFRLGQNYPNPASHGEIIIPIYMHEKSHIRLNLYDINGFEIENLVDETLEKGDHHVSVSIDDLSSGIYFYHMSSGNNQKIKKMIVMK